MKKINRKGFTLIELLAVIVILAIILVVTVPNIIKSINDARISSIHNLAVSAANTYDKAFAQDLIEPTATKKILGNIPTKITTSWQCIDTLTNTADATKPVKLIDILGVSKSDVVVGSDTGVTAPSGDNPTVTQNTCSAIRLNATNNSAEVILVAKTTGKFFVAQYVTYALSTADNGAQVAATAPAS